ncbi:MAG: prolyl oligopeptidase family serine peptidase [Salegentibacter sp.]
MRTRILYLFFVILMILLMAPFAAAAQDHKFDEFQKENFVKEGDTLPYRILFPENFKRSKKYPVVLFLHGAGERGNDNQAQLVHGGDLFLKTRKEFPAIVIFPQVPKDDYWANVEVNRKTRPFEFDYHSEGEPTRSMELTMELMDSVSKQKFVDRSRVYVAGLSMGGMGTYEILGRRPEMFAAAIAICGGADPEIAKKYNPNLDIWIFAGEKDDIVPPEFSKTMSRVINHLGRDAKLSLYPNDNHNSWDSALAEPSLLPWLFNHTLNRK